MATINLTSARRAKLVKALDYFAAINDNSDNPPRSGSSTNRSSPLTGRFRPAIKKFVETYRSFMNQAKNTHGMDPATTAPKPGPTRRYPFPG